MHTFTHAPCIHAEQLGSYYFFCPHSGLLNMLDGVASTEERIVFMTTNHVERCQFVFLLFVFFLSFP
jgi:hypothetical protein